MLLEERLNKDWYQKRINQNKIIKKHLIDIILKNYNRGFFWRKNDLQYLNYEDLFEIAVASSNKKLEITLGKGSDLSNNADCKFSVARVHNYGKSYSALIPGCINKEHIYACVYEGIQKKFYYFSFPVTLKEHTIPFELDGSPKRSNYMWGHEKTTFRKMVEDK